MAKNKDKSVENATTTPPKNAGISQEQFEMLMSTLTEVKEQNKVLTETNNQFRAKFDDFQAQQPVVQKKAPVFLAAKKYITQVKSGDKLYKVKFRSQHVKRGDVLVAGLMPGIPISRTRIDDIIDNEKVMTKLFEQEKKSIEKGKPSGYLELVKIEQGA